MHIKSINKLTKTVLSGAVLAAAFVVFTPASASAASYANSHVDLPANTQLTSDNGQNRLLVQTDGNLVAYFGGNAYWSTNTGGPVQSGYKLAVQGDGNLVLYRNNVPYWSTGTSDPSGAQLRIQNDGNVVLVGNSRGLLWASNKVPTRLYAGQMLDGARSWTIYSPNYRYRMVMQPDATVVLYDRNTPIWSKHGGSGQTPGTLEMQTDGNLVLYGRNHVALWASGSSGPNGSYLEGQDDGNFVLYSPSRAVLWSTRGDTTPDVGGTTGGLLGGSDRDLATKIINSGRVSGDGRYMDQIRKYKDGNFSCHINPTILSLIWTSVAPTNQGGLGHTLYITSLNRLCTGVLTGSGATSYHYANRGGHAVDIGKIDGVTSTGWSPTDRAYLRQIMTRIPSGSGIGQSTCRSDNKVSIAMPSGIRQFYDTCNHNHIEVPQR